MSFRLQLIRPAIRVHNHIRDIGSVAAIFSLVCVQYLLSWSETFSYENSILIRWLLTWKVLGISCGLARIASACVTGLTWNNLLKKVRWKSQSSILHDVKRSLSFLATALCNLLKIEDHVRIRSILVLFRLVEYDFLLAHDYVLLFPIAMALDIGFIRDW